jgi:ribosome-binding factor A
MPKDFSRTLRVADQIQRSLAQLIQLEVSDPRVGLVNINDVEVSRDYAIARVFVTFVDRESQAECEQSVEALNKAAGFLRVHLAKSLNTRTTPRLQFVYDMSAIEGPKIDRLIDNALQADRDHHANQD